MALGLHLQGRTLANLRILLVVAPSSLLFGYNQSAIGGMLGFESFARTFPEIDTVYTTGITKLENSKIQGTVVAIYCLACLTGALVSALVGNRLGRRLTLVVAAAVASVGLVLQCSSFGLAQLIVGRLVCGLGVGAINTTVPVWQAECVKPKSRGKNIVILGVFAAAGIALASWINFGMSSMQHSSLSWRLPTAIPIVFLACVLCCTYLFPESPRWLAMKGRLEDAEEAMAVLADGNTDLETIRGSIEGLQRDTQSGERGWSHLFSMGPDKLLYRLALAILINMAAQMTGANTISFYANTIFTQSLKLEKHTASLLSAVLLTWKIPAAAVSFFSVDRFGRKPLFLISLLGMGTSMACLAGTVSDINNHSASVAAVVFLFVYMSFFPLAFLGANFLLAVEIGPQDLRVHCSAFGIAIHWLCNFIVAEITPVAFDSIGWRYYIVYAVISFVFAPLIYFLFPETKARSLEDIEDLFRSTEHWWQVASAARHPVPGQTRSFDLGDTVEAGPKEAGPEEALIGHVEDQKRQA